MIRHLAFLVLLSFAAQARAQDVAAAGRLEYAGSDGGCSAALVRPDVIVSAAHCLSTPERPEGVFFRPGDGPHGELYPVDLVFRHPLYDPASDKVEWRLRFDIAVGRLARPVPGARALPFAQGAEAKVGESLFIISWRVGGPDRPRQRACPVIEGIDGLVTLGCEVRGGESGAPVLRQTPSGPQLVAVINSRRHILNQPVAQASDVAIRLDPLLAMIDRAGP